MIIDINQPEKITITFQHMLSSDFQMSFAKVSRCANLAGKTPYWVYILGEIFVAKQKEFLVERDRQLHGKVKLEESGVFKLNEAKDDYEWEDGVDPLEVKKGVEEFGKTSFETRVHKFQLSELEPAKLSAIDLGNLKPIFLSPEE